MTAWTFGPYRIESLIARGGMGEVHRAYDTRFDRVVALKLLSGELAHDPAFQERFRRESQTAARLSDPHVIPIHSYGAIDGRLYLDMRLVEGLDVAQQLRERGPMAPEDAVSVVAQLADALDSAHAAGLVHRDVKPSNALMTGDGFVYLVDFGIANALADSGAAGLTGSGVVGTVDYIAPERLARRSGLPIDHRVDVYALGALLHECLTGRRPYPGREPAATMYAQIHEPVPCPSRVRPGLPPGFDGVVARGMAKHPDQRYASAGELARAAREALAGGGAAAAPGPTPVGDGGREAPRTAPVTSRASAPRRRQRRKGAPLYAAAGVAAAVAAGVLLASRLGGDPGAHTVADDPPAASGGSASASASQAAAHGKGRMGGHRTKRPSATPSRTPRDTPSPHGSGGATTAGRPPSGPPSPSGGTGGSPTPSASPRGGQDLGLSRPMRNLGCTGGWITVVGKGGDPATWQQRMQGLLNSYSGSSYLWDGNSCSSLRVQLDEMSSAEYSAYLGPFASGKDACAATTKGDYTAIIHMDGSEADEPPC